MQQSRSHSNIFASYSSVFLEQNQRDVQSPACSNLSGARLSNLQPSYMDLDVDARQFLSAVTCVFPMDMACELLLAFPVIDVLIEGFEQQILMSLVKVHHLTCRDFISLSIEEFGPSLQWCVVHCPAVLQRGSVRASRLKSVRHLEKDWHAALHRSITARFTNTGQTDCGQDLEAVNLSAASC